MMTTAVCKSASVMSVGQRLCGMMVSGHLVASDARREDHASTSAMAQTTANPYSVTNKGIVTLGNNATVSTAATTGTNTTTATTAPASAATGTTTVGSADGN